MIKTFIDRICVLALLSTKITTGALILMIYCFSNYLHPEVDMCTSLQLFFSFDSNMYVMHICIFSLIMLVWTQPMGAFTLIHCKRLENISSIVIVSIVLTVCILCFGISCFVPIIINIFGVNFNISMHIQIICTFMFGIMIVEAISGSFANEDCIRPPTVLNKHIRRLSIIIPVVTVCALAASLSMYKGPVCCNCDINDPGTNSIIILMFFTLLSAQFTFAYAYYHTHTLFDTRLIDWTPVYDRPSFVHLTLGTAISILSLFIHSIIVYDITIIDIKITISSLFQLIAISMLLEISIQTTLAFTEYNVIRLRKLREHVSANNLETVTQNVWYSGENDSL